MALEELLRVNDAQTEARQTAVPESAPEKGGLIRQVCALFGQSAGEAPATAAEDAAAKAAACADGYMRRSPVQPYQTAEDFTRRRVRRIVLILVGLAVVAALGLALIRAGLLQVRLR